MIIRPYRLGTPDCGGGVEGTRLPRFARNDMGKGLAMTKTRIERPWCQWMGICSERVRGRMIIRPYRLGTPDCGGGAEGTGLPRFARDDKGKGLAMTKTRAERPWCQWMGICSERVRGRMIIRPYRLGAPDCGGGAEGTGLPRFARDDKGKGLAMTKDENRRPWCQWMGICSERVRGRMIIRPLQLGTPECGGGAEGTGLPRFARDDQDENRKAWCQWMGFVRSGSGGE